ncbi:MAG: gliding motility-associated protein GldE [Flavobacteriales bacterium]
MILLVFSALISGAEVAYFSLSMSDLESLKENKNKLIIKLLKSPNSLLATILIVNNFINVAIIFLSAYLTTISIVFAEDSVLEFIFQVVIITCLLVLFGEITPKIYAHHNAIKFSLWMAKPLIFLNKALYPISFLLVSTTSIIENRLKRKELDVNIDEISKALDLTDQENKSKEGKILRSIVEFGDTDVKEIMKSRVDVIAIDKKTKFSDLLKLIVSSGYSRIPVYDVQFDNVLGILYIKDLIPYLSKGDSFKWLDLCRAPFFVPENKMINDLLKEFQAKKNHIAIVVDEYGGASGIVTLEDVLEEIVGEINDEFDDDHNNYSKLDDNNFVFEGKILLIDFLKIINYDLDYFDDLKGESDSLAGLILENEGRIPKIGDVIIIKSFTFQIESVDLRRIKRIKVTLNEI